MQGKLCHGCVLSPPCCRGDHYMFWFSFHLRRDSAAQQCGLWNCLSEGSAHSLAWAKGDFPSRGCRGPERICQTQCHFCARLTSEYGLKSLNLPLMASKRTAVRNCALSPMVPPDVVMGPDVAQLGPQWFLGAAGSGPTTEAQMLLRADWTPVPASAPGLVFSTLPGLMHFMSTLRPGKL